MKLIGIFNELYNNNKLENKKFKTPDGTILSNTSDLLKYIGFLNDEWFDLEDIIENLQDEIEIIDDKEYEDIEQLRLVDIQNLWDRDIEIEKKINTLIRNQKYILEEIKKLKED